MQIPCPHCGPREVHEFTYVGDASRVRPPLDAPRAAWCAYLYERENPIGWHREHWQHTAGCRAVLTVERDTLTHEIRGSAPATAVGPAREAVEEPAE